MIQWLKRLFHSESFYFHPKSLASQATAGGMDSMTQEDYQRMADMTNRSGTLRSVEDDSQ
jgi:hypothetical protein